MSTLRLLNTGLLLLSLAFPALPQVKRQEIPTKLEGLDRGYVTDLLQDKRGFIWVGTLNGLLRYDGHEVKRYQPMKSKPWSLQSSNIVVMREDRQGLLWLHTEKGLVVMEPFTERFLNIKELIPDRFPDGQVNTFVILKNGSLLVNHTTGFSEISIPVNLKEMIRAGKVPKTGFSVRQAVLQPGIQSPFYFIHAINDSLIITSDASRRWCRIHPQTLAISPLHADEAGAKQDGNYSLLVSPENNMGLVFRRNENMPHARPHFDSVSIFLTLPDGQKVLFNEQQKTLYKLQISSAHIQHAGFYSDAFRLQFPELITLDKPMTTFMVDASSNIWIGTNGYGVRIVKPENDDFVQHFPNISFSNFTFLPDGHLWPGIYKSKTIADLQHGTWKGIALPGDFNTWLNIYSLFVSRDKDMWAVVLLRQNHLALFRYQAALGRWIQMPLLLAFQFEVPLVFSEDSQGHIWLAGNHGQILRIHPADNRVEEWSIRDKIPPQFVGRLRSYCMTQGNQDTLWIGTSCGLVQIAGAYDAKPRFRLLHSDPDGNMLFSNENILSLLPDKENRHLLWLGTKLGGLDRLDTRSGTVKNYFVKGGLNDNVFYGILPDSLGQLWISSNQGILRFDPEKERFSNLFDTDSPIQTEFNTGSHALLPDGRLAFGSIDGLFIINPNSISRASSRASIAITQIKSADENLHDLAMEQFLSLSQQDEYCLKLPHERNNLYIAFAALPPDNMNIYQYRYRLSTLGKDWLELGNEQSLNLAGLPAGSHVLELQAVALDADWSTAGTTRLFIRILPPWYFSLPALLLYALAFFSAITWFFKNQKKQLELKFDADLSQQESQRLKSLSEFKSRFFAYIAHEFKTPLTLIVGLTGRMKASASEQEQEGIKSGILSQSQNMMELINQLIDVGRMQDNNLQLHWQQGNISRQVESTVASLWPLAQFQDVKLAFETDVPNLTMDYDPLRLQYMLSNLVTNAIRHSPPGSTVRVRLLQPELHTLYIVVSDQGKGIPAEHLPRIFEPYYRVESPVEQGGNFGLGLAFVKDLAGLFHGDIRVESTPGQGTAFTVLLPVTHNAPLQDANTQELLTMGQPDELLLAGQPAQQKNLPLVLVVEDNETIAMYIQSALASRFRLVLASNGVEGWEKTLQLVPDLILTDYIMPGMDGLMLTRKVKSHQLTSHIPVVMLSARFELSDRLSGHEHGVDVYLPKPFHEKELILILQNLIALKQRWQDRYSTVEIFNKAGEVDPTFPPQDDMAVQQTDLFMRRMYTVFEENLSNEEFSREDLCKALHVSRSQLQRKLAAISSESAMELLRQFRLSKASQLLGQEPNLKIQDVCYKVGFKYPDYFSKLFLKRFGVLPTEYRKLQQPEN